MKVTRTREMRINLGNFEHIVTTATVELEMDDDAFGPKEANVLNKQLDGLLADDIRDAVDSSGQEESFIYTWHDNHGGK